MKACHAAALAVFWLIIRPPLLGPAGPLDRNAPLKKWAITEMILDTYAQCEKIRGQIIQDVAKNPSIKEGLLTYYRQSDALRIFEGMKEQYEHSVCVSSDDPRLNGY